MLINKTFQYRLRPTYEQEQILQQYAGGCRFIYNWGLAEYKKILEKPHSDRAEPKPDELLEISDDSRVTEPEQRQIDENQVKDINSQDEYMATEANAARIKKKYPTSYDLMNQSVALKSNPDTIWLATVPAQALQQALIDLGLSMKAFFRERKRNPLYGFPRFKAKGNRDSFRIPSGLKVEGKRVYCPKIGWVLYYDRYDRAPEGKIKQGTFKYNGLHWYVCIVTEIEIPEQESQNDTLPTVISQTIADNQRYILVGDQEILVPKFMDSELVAYKRLSRRLSRCTKDSKRYAKAHKKLLAFSIMIANRRKDFLHKLTTSIINTHDSIEIKSEDIRKKIQGNRWHQNRLLYDLAWGMLEAQLKYKTQWHGKKLVIEK